MCVREREREIKSVCEKEKEREREWQRRSLRLKRHVAILRIVQSLTWTVINLN